MKSKLLNINEQGIMMQKIDIYFQQTVILFTLTLAHHQTIHSKEILPRLIEATNSITTQLTSNRPMTYEAQRQDFTVTNIQEQGQTENDSKINESYRISLLEMEKKDQAIRKDFLSLVSKKTSSDEINKNEELKKFALKIHAGQNENSNELKKLISTFGFPNFALVGKDGAHAAFLLIQHSTDKQFRIEFCEQAEKFAKNGNFSPADVAYLVDRNRIFEGKPQLYGTQKKPDGTLYEIEKPELLNSRRQSVGLQEESKEGQ